MRGHNLRISPVHVLASGAGDKEVAKDALQGNV